MAEVTYSEADRFRPISFEDAKARGYRWFFTGEPCVHGHIARRYISSKGCKTCTEIGNKRNGKNNQGVALFSFTEYSRMKAPEEQERLTKQNVKKSKYRKNRKAELDARAKNLADYILRIGA